MSPQVSCGQQFCPSFCGVNENWKLITVNKRNEHGQIRRALKDNTPVKFQYTQEVSTGDLWGVEGNEPDSCGLIAVKATLIFILTPLFYMPCVMAANFIKIGIDITSIFWKVIPQIVRDCSVEGFFAAVKSGLKTITWGIPKEILKDIWGICRCPIFALGMMFASLYAIVSPYEGRKWIGRVESAWHDGRTFRAHCRCDPSFLDDLKMERVFFFAPCMQKKGNIADKIANKNKFELI